MVRDSAGSVEVLLRSRNPPSLLVHPRALMGGGGSDRSRELPSGVPEPSGQLMGVNGCGIREE